MYVHNPMTFEWTQTAALRFGADSIISILSVVIAGISLVVTHRSGRSSGDSAAAAKESATAARETVMLQKTQWDEYRTARLVVGFTRSWRPYWAKTPDDTRVQSEISIINVGMASAHRLAVSCEQPPESIDFVIRRMEQDRVFPDETITFRIDHRYIAGEPVILTFVLAYRDGIGINVQTVQFKIRMSGEEDESVRTRDSAVLSSRVMRTERYGGPE